MSREIKIGALALLVLLVSIWGYTFLKGKNLLKKSFTFQTTYTDVTQLSKSSPVYINGYKVGSVLDIELDKESLKKMIVTFDIENDFKIPKDAVINQINDGLMGGRALSVNFEKQCTGANCAQDGDMLNSRIVGLLESMIATDDVQEYANVVGKELGTVIENLGTEEGKGAVNKTLLELQATMENMAKLTATTNRIMAQSANNMAKTMENMNSITTNLAESNAQISAMLSNFAKVSTQIKDADVGNTINKSTATIEDAQKVMTSLTGTLSNADNAIKNLNGMISKATQGDGTLSKKPENDPAFIKD